jgi:hypothetical protein
MNNQKRDNVSMVFITCCMEQGLCAGIRLPLHSVSSYKIQRRQMAYNGTVVSEVN